MTEFEPFVDVARLAQNVRNSARRDRSYDQVVTSSITLLIVGPIAFAEVVKRLQRKRARRSQSCEPASTGRTGCAPGIVRSTPSRTFASPLWVLSKLGRRFWDKILVTPFVGGKLGFEPCQAVLLLDIDMEVAGDAQEELPDPMGMIRHHKVVPCLSG